MDAWYNMGAYSHPPLVSYAFAKDSRLNMYLFGLGIHAHGNRLCGNSCRVFRPFRSKRVMLCAYRADEQRITGNPVDGNNINKHVNASCRLSDWKSGTLVHPAIRVICPLEKTENLCLRHRAVNELQIRRSANSSCK